MGIEKKTFLGRKWVDTLGTTEDVRGIVQWDRWHFCKFYIVANSVNNTSHRILALYSHVRVCVCDQAWHFHLSPPYDVLDHANHIFYESLSSCDDIDRDKDLQKDKYEDKDTQTQTKTNTKCFQHPIYAIFFISGGFKDLNIILAIFLWWHRQRQNPI